MTIAELLQTLHRLEQVAPRSKPAARGALAKVIAVLDAHADKTIDGLVSDWSAAKAPTPPRKPARPAALRQEVVDRHAGAMRAAAARGDFPAARAALDALKSDKTARNAELRAIAHHVTGGDPGKMTRDGYLQALSNFFRNRLSG